MTDRFGLDVSFCNRLKRADVESDFNFDTQIDGDDGYADMMMMWIVNKQHATTTTNTTNQSTKKCKRNNTPLSSSSILNV